MKIASHEVVAKREERAVLVSLVSGELRRQAELAAYSLQELVLLAETAGLEVLETISQNRETADTKWLIGKGKVEELKALLLAHDANIAVFDQELSGAQVRNLEESLDVKIIDRTQLILDIFAQRAKTREGILQVELAQLSYLLPRLSGQGKNLSRLGGGIGTRGPGETKLETDRRHIRERIAELKRQLQEVVRHRTLHRERRRKSGIVQVALVGYTNAGKSTLLNRLTNADVYVQNQLFATLDPTSRALKLPSGKEIVLTDTVGFIQHLPHDLVAAFRATLEEVNEANLILHVVDSSSAMREEQMAVVAEVLEELGAHQKSCLVVFNKTDLIPANEQELLAATGDYIRMSAMEDADLERLKLLLQSRLSGHTLTFRLPAARGDLLALLYRVGDVIAQRTSEENDMLEFDVSINDEDYAKNGHLLVPFVVTATA
ncbi:GTPase HflX [Paenibacillus cymbidii]|uniref:GTPase HflX n=1 Tax=Paenibacillus cymbidii TaxID=1639034 RepID=UPI0010821835|nr:GTPase HflX [Paenibacillus cymbidii]